MSQTLFARFRNSQPEVPIGWLSDNEGISASLETLIQAEQLNLAPTTTP